MGSDNQEQNWEAYVARLISGGLSELSYWAFHKGIPWAGGNTETVVRDCLDSLFESGTDLEGAMIVELGSERSEIKTYHHRSEQ